MNLAKEALSLIALAVLVAYYTLAVAIFGKGAADDMLDDGGAL